MVDVSFVGRGVVGGSVVGSSVVGDSVVGNGMVRISLEGSSVVRSGVKVYCCKAVGEGKEVGVVVLGEP